MIKTFYFTLSLILVYCKYINIRISVFGIIIIFSSIIIIKIIVINITIIIIIIIITIIIIIIINKKNYKNISTNSVLFKTYYYFY